MEQKQLIDFNQQIYSRKKNTANFFLESVEKVIELYNDLNIGALDPKDLGKLFLNTQSFMDEKIYQSKDLSSIANLGLSKSKLIEMLEKPVGYAALIEKIDFIDRWYKKQDVDNVFSTNSLKDFLRLFVVNDKNEISFSETVLSSLKEALSTYISSPKAKETFAFANELIALYKKYNIKVTNQHDNTFFIEKLIRFESNEPVINKHYVSQIDRNAQGKS